MLVCSSGVTVLPPVPESNWGLTVVLALAVKAHVPVPLQGPPLQPAKMLPGAGVATRVAIEPTGTFSVQLLPQLSAPPDRVTVPLPVPILATVSVPTDVMPKVAVTLLYEFMVTVHEPVPLQSPDQPEKL